MREKLKQFRNKYQMFSAQDVVIAGVSGGADSMCLLCVLDEWRKELGFELIVVHVNHGIRGEAADQDETYVNQICMQRGIPVLNYHCDVRKMAREQHLSEEEAGRMARREAFEDAAAKYQGTKIALAHHKNDNAETFLFHLARGSKLKGLGGMRPVSGKYVRPLLSLERGEIELFLKQEKISYCVDESNATDDYTRNRIRRHVIPYMEAEINQKTVEHMDQTMKYLQEVQEYLEVQMEILWKELVEKTETGICIKEELKEQPALMRGMIFRKAMTDIAGEEKDILEVHVEALEELLWKQTGRKRDLPYQMEAAKTYQGLEIRRKMRAQDPLEQAEIPLTDGRFLYHSLEIEVKVFEKGEETLEPPKKRFTKWFDYDIITQSVCIRGRKQGDRIVVSEDGKSQKLKQFLINEKIPQHLRDQIPMIAEGNQILWIVGYRQSKAYQVTAQTKRILEVKISGGNEDGR